MSCTSNFSFTAHPEDYDGCSFIPPTSISIRRHVITWEDDVCAAWPSDDGDGGGVVPLPDELLGLQRDIVLSMALTLDDVLGHILDIFARQRDLGARIVGARDEAESSVVQLSEYVNTMISNFRDAVLVDIGDLRKSFNSEIDAVSKDVNLRVTALEERMDRLERRLDLLPSTSPIPPLLAIRGSLSALERAATKRLTDHANSLMVSLSRRRGSRAPDRNGGRTSGASGWSVASDSQLSVDAPADHGGDAPVSLRGGGTDTHRNDSPSPKVVGSPSSHQCRIGTDLLHPSAGTGVYPDQGPPAPVDLPAVSARGRMPTPWTNGNEFSA